MTCRSRETELDLVWIEQHQTLDLRVNLVDLLAHLPQQCQAAVVRSKDHVFSFDQDATLLTPRAAGDSMTNHSHVCDGDSIRREDNTIVPAGNKAIGSLNEAFAFCAPYWSMRYTRFSG